MYEAFELSRQNFHGQRRTRLDLDSDVVVVAMDGKAKRTAVQYERTDYGVRAQASRIERVRIRVPILRRYFNREVSSIAVFERTVSQNLFGKVTGRTSASFGWLFDRLRRHLELSLVFKPDVEIGSRQIGVHRKSRRRRPSDCVTGSVCGIHHGSVRIVRHRGNRGKLGRAVV